MTKGFRKKLNAPRVRNIQRKGLKWTVKAAPGPHPAEESVPLKVALRDTLKAVKTGKEAERIIKEGKVQIDKKNIKNPKYPVGFMDVLTISNEEKGYIKNYRTLYDHKGRIEFKEIDEKDAKHKLGRVKTKNKIKEGKTQITLHDGKTVIEEKSNPGDTVKITLPNKKVEKRIKLTKGNLAYIISGKHAGETLKITGITPGTMKRDSLIELGDIKTQKRNVFAIGEKKPEIKIGE